ncbi:MAG: ribonuclease HII [Bacteroidales bacterium]|nr:ribonuclease HII [Bacteroidales bacterium]
MLEHNIIQGRLEAGCDEAGRGPLAGPVVAAAVVLPPAYSNPVLNDSKQLSERQRNLLRPEIEQQALAWAVAVVDAEEIDRLNILHASTHAMCLAANALLGTPSPQVTSGGTALGTCRPEFLIVDGNRFYNETPLPYQCVVGGDAKYMPVAAASILAKTYRDEIMLRLHNQYPHYGWDRNKGYPTAEHFRAIEQYGPSPLHRRSFTLYRQHTLFES